MSAIGRRLLLQGAGSLAGRSAARRDLAASPISDLGGRLPSLAPTLPPLAVWPLPRASGSWIALLMTAPAPPRGGRCCSAYPPIEGDCAILDRPDWIRYNSLFVSGVCVMALNFTILDAEHDEIFDAAIAGIPRVAEKIAAVPPEQRARALDAAEQSYQKTAADLGYAEATAQEWASELMFRLSTYLSA